MDNNAKTQQLIATLVMRAVTRFSEGKSKREVIAELENDGASREVAEIIATKGEAMKKPEGAELKKPEPQTTSPKRAENLIEKKKEPAVETKAGRDNKENTDILKPASEVKSLKSRIKNLFK